MNFFYFIPAIGWGLMPVVAQRTKASPINQLLGTTTVAFLFALGISVVTQPTYSTSIWAVSFLSGCFWSVGQYLQFASFRLLPVYEAMPLSNGSQLIGTTFVAVAFFGEWRTSSQIFLGSLGLLFVVSGMLLTACTKKEIEKATNNSEKGKAVLLLLVSSLALIGYVTIPRAFEVTGSGVFLPQAFGMWLSSLVYARRKREDVSVFAVSRNFGTGFCWSIANLSLFLLIPALGVAKSFTFSQLAVVFSIFVGLLSAEEKKTRKECFFISLGALLIVFGILLIGRVK